MAEEKALPEMQAAEIAPAAPKRPPRPLSMKVAAFSSATWANDADFEAATEEQSRKVCCACGLPLTDVQYVMCVMVMRT